MSDDGITVNNTRYSPEAIAMMAGRIAELERVIDQMGKTITYWGETSNENYNLWLRARKWSKRWKDNARFWRHGYRDWRIIANYEGEKLMMANERAQSLSAAIVKAGKLILNGNEAAALSVLLTASFDDDVQMGIIDPEQLRHRVIP